MTKDASVFTAVLIAVPRIRTAKMVDTGQR
jgi:hypothetical protein